MAFVRAEEKSVAAVQNKFLPQIELELNSDCIK